MRVLATRALTDAQRAYARQLGLTVEEDTFLQVVHCPEVLFQGNEPLPILLEVSVDAWLISSSNAIPTVKALLPFVAPPVMGVVGEKTAYKLEKQLGIRPEFIAPNAAKLAHMLIAMTDFQRFFFFSGNKRLETLPDSLSAAGKELLEWTVYETDLLPHKVADCPQTVLFFSPSGVEAFIEQNTWEPDRVGIAIGSTTAAVFHRFTGAEAVVAPTPSVEAVLSTAATLQHQTRQIT